MPQRLLAKPTANVSECMNNLERAYYTNLWPVWEINRPSVKLSWQNTVMKQYLGPGQALEMGMRMEAYPGPNVP